MGRTWPGLRRVVRKQNFDVLAMRCQSLVSVDTIVQWLHSIESVFMEPTWVSFDPNLQIQTGVITMKFPLLSAAAAMAACLIVSTATHAHMQEASFLLGSPAAIADADRAITLTSETRWANVNYGESVRFIVGNREFAWKFDGPDSRSFDLREVAPSDLIMQPVRVYVARRFELH